MHRWLIALALALGIGAFAPPVVHAEDVYDYDYYECYDAGWDADANDDWFYDYYEYDDACVYDDVGDDDDYGYDEELWDYGYDYDTDLFDWEEDGLFE